MAATHDLYVGELKPQHTRDGSRDSGIFHTTKGLWNAPGLNNCFLNSAVQVSDILNSTLRYRWFWYQIHYQRHNYFACFEMTVAPSVVWLACSFALKTKVLVYILEAATIVYICDLFFNFIWVSLIYTLSRSYHLTYNICTRFLKRKNCLRYTREIPRGHLWRSANKFVRGWVKVDVDTILLVNERVVLEYLFCELGYLKILR